MNLNTTLTLQAHLWWPFWLGFLFPLAQLDGMGYRVKSSPGFDLLDGKIWLMRLLEWSNSTINIHLFISTSSQLVGQPAAIQWLIWVQSNTNWLACTESNSNSNNKLAELFGKVRAQPRRWWRRRRAKAVFINSTQGISFFYWSIKKRMRSFPKPFDVCVCGFLKQGEENIFD